MTRSQAGQVVLTKTAKRGPCFSACESRYSLPSMPIRAKSGAWLPSGKGMTLTLPFAHRLAPKQIENSLAIRLHCIVRQKVLRPAQGQGIGQLATDAHLLAHVVGGTGHGE